MIVIDRGKISDIDELELLYNDLNYYFECHTNYPGWKKGIYPVRQTAADGIECGGLFVARIENRIVGTVILRHEPEPAYSQADWHVDLSYDDILVVHTLAVHPLFLKRGVGKKLMGFILEYGKENNIKAIRLDVYEKNKPAINLYKQYGFQFIDKVDLGYGHYGLEYFELYQKIL